MKNKKSISKSKKANIMIQTWYAAPYRVNVFKELEKKFDVEVFFEKQNGDKRNQKFFQNKNSLNCYFINTKNGKKIYRKRIKRIKDYDLVLVYEYSDFLSLKLMLRCICNKVPYILNCDGYVEKNEKGIKNYIKSKIKKYFITHARMCLANGMCGEKYFLKYGAKKENIAIHHFSSVRKKDILKSINVSDKLKYKEELGFDESKKLYLSIGSFDYRKAFELLLYAIKNINDKDNQYVIIGGGQLYNEYKNYCITNKLDNVIIKDFLTPDELKKYYIASDAFILPTREDIWGLVINEAMSYGLPILSTNMCMAAVEMVNDNNGIIVKANSEEEIEKGLLKLNSFSKEELIKMGENALKVSKNYNIEDIGISQINTLEKVLKK